MHITITKNINQKYCGVVHICSYRSIQYSELSRGLGGLSVGWLEAGAAHGSTADTAAGDGEHHRDHDLENISVFRFNSHI